MDSFNLRKGWNPSFFNQSQLHFKKLKLLLDRPNCFMNRLTADIAFACNLRKVFAFHAELLGKGQLPLSQETPVSANEGGDPDSFFFE
jgi:hypothetical protein